jgi:hypothetical protein
VRVCWVLIVGLFAASSAWGQATVQVRVPRVGGHPLAMKKFAAHSTTTASPSAEFVSLRRGEVVGARTGREATRVRLPASTEVTGTGAAERDKAVVPFVEPGSVRLALPFEFVAITAAGGEVRYRPVAEVEGGAARFDPALRLFTGTVSLGLELLPPSVSGRLPQPVRLYVVSDADHTTPANVTLNRLGLPFRRVHLQSAAPPNALTVRVRTDVDPEAVVVSVPVQRPTLDLQASPARIQGLGLEVSQIVVRAVGLRSYDSVTVTLATDRGSLDSLVIPLDARGIGRSAIRSISAGQARIRAESPPFEAAEVTVVFLWPWAFLVAALLGGVAGAVGRESYQRQKTGGGPAGAPRSMLAAMVAGVVVAAAWSVGVNLLGTSPAAHAGEAVVFVLSAMGAYAGHQVLAPTPKQASASPGGSH